MGRKTGKLRGKIVLEDISIKLARCEV